MRRRGGRRPPRFFKKRRKAVGPRSISYLRNDPVTRDGLHHASHHARPTHRQFGVLTATATAPTRPRTPPSACPSAMTHTHTPRPRPPAGPQMRPSPPTSHHRDQPARAVLDACGGLHPRHAALHFSAPRPPPPVPFLAGPALARPARSARTFAGLSLNDSPLSSLTL